ncbi:uncharacterized protein LOC143038789 [Oratosquilla oratoria]|uniref:uncharacterized protein LOC143038789 n=1 Tax=Oratosquilla oratoria TaxID=337810 RepID=UPI003F75FB0B
MASLLATIQEDQIDVVLLQETLLQDHHTFRVPGYTCYRKDIGSTGRGLATLVKNKTPSVQIKDYLECGEATEVLVVQIQLAGVTLQCYNLYSRPTEKIDLSQLFGNCDSHNIVFGGDINAHHPILSSPSTTNANGHHVAHLLSEFQDVCLLNSGAPTHIRGGRLDLTFLPAKLRSLAQWRVHPFLTSDHYATITKIKIPQIQLLPSPPKGWNSAFAKWDKFAQSLTEWFEDYTPPLDIDNQEKDLVTAFHAAADAAMPRKKKPKRECKDTWYYCPRVKTLKHRVNRLRKIHKRRPNADNRKQLQEAIRHMHEEFSTVIQPPGSYGDGYTESLEKTGPAGSSTRIRNKKQTA